MLNVEIISPQGFVFQGQSHMVVVPSSVGDVGVMEDHEAFVANLKEGKILVYEVAGQSATKEFAIQSGVAEIHDGKRLLVLLDS